MKFLLACASTMLLVVSPTAADFRVFVSAGASSRVDTPVFVEIKDNSLTNETPVCVAAGDERLPGQVETRRQGDARVWWIVPRLAAGESKEYTIHTNMSCSNGVFVWRDEAGVKADLLFGDRPVLRYMYRAFDSADIEGTKKPFHHVFDPDGSRMITKGADGLYPHHRGVFFGYNRCTVGGERYDVWHAARGEHQVHRKVIAEFAGPVAGGHVVTIHWNDRDGKPFAEETRTLLAYRQSKGASLMEFFSTLRATAGPVELNGDRQHAGVQYRAAQEVAEHQKDTRYLRPAAWKDLPADREINSAAHRDLPWNALQYKLGGRHYTVAYLSDPKNPDGADFSERLYGRFGEFFPYTLTEDRPLTVRYRFWITTCASVTRDQIRDRYSDLATPPGVRLVD